MRTSAAFIAYAVRRRDLPVATSSSLVCSVWRKRPTCPFSSTSKLHLMMMCDDLLATACVGEGGDVVILVL